MKKIFLCLPPLFILIGVTYAQKKPVMTCPKVFFSSTEVTESSCDTSIAQVRNAIFKDRLVIKYRNGTKKNVPLDSMWGYREKNGNPCRIYRTNHYSLYALSPVCKYSMKAGKATRYFFSTNLNSSIYPYTPEQLRLHSDSAVYNAMAKEAATNRHEIAADFYGLNTRVLDNGFWGAGLDVTYSPLNKWGTGLSFIFASRHITDTFSFSIKEPLVAYWEIGWLNQFNVIAKDKFRMNAGIINGVSVCQLLDDGEKTTRRTRYGQRDVAKSVATNYYYLLEPGIDVLVRLVSNSHNPDVYLAIKTGYRFVFGNSSFASPNAFTGTSIALGLSVIGFDKVQF